MLLVCCVLCALYSCVFCFHMFHVSDSGSGVHVRWATFVMFASACSFVVLLIASFGCRRDSIGPFLAIMTHLLPGTRYTFTSRCLYASKIIGCHVPPALQLFQRLDQTSYSCKIVVIIYHVRQN